MAVIKEWCCAGHGPFEGPDPVCPHGCTTVTQEFRTAPGGRSNKTRFTDSSLEAIAREYNLKDLSNRKGSVMRSVAPVANDYQTRWEQFNGPAPKLKNGHIQGPDPVGTWLAQHAKDAEGAKGAGVRLDGALPPPKPLIDPMLRHKG